MTNSIERVTLENAADQLKAKIRSAFVELLPEEQWKEMVAAELKRFAEPTTERNYHGSTTNPSGLSKLCHEVFTEHIKAELKALLASPEWQTVWTNQGYSLPVAIKSWLTENSTRLIESTVQALAGQAAQRVLESMRHL